MKVEAIHVRAPDEAEVREVGVVEAVAGKGLDGDRYFFADGARPGLALTLIDGGSFVVALVFILSYGIANGLKAVQRATLPLALFGRGQFGAHMGRLALPQGIVAAAAPPVLAAVLSAFGTPGALWLVFVAAMISLIAMILLARLARTIR